MTNTLYEISADFLAALDAMEGRPLHRRTAERRPA